MYSKQPEVVKVNYFRWLRISTRIVRVFMSLSIWWVPEFNCQYVQAILCAGLYPNIAANDKGITEAAVNSLTKQGNQTKSYSAWYDGRREVHIHPSSINSNFKAFQHPFLVFLEKVI